MRKRIKVSFAIVLACLAAAIAIILLTRETEPSYQGRSLSEWLLTPKESTPDPNFDRRDLYILTQSSLADPSYLRTLWEQYNRPRSDALRHMGTNAIPYLVKWAAYEPPKWRKPLDLLCTNFPTLQKNRYFHAAFYQTDLRPVQARIAFGLLGTNGAPALPDLARIAANTNKPAPANCARLCIDQILLGFPAFSNRTFLESALHDPNPIVREEAKNVNFRRLLSEGLFDP